MPKRDPHTADLFTWKPPQISVGYSPDVTGVGALEAKIARLLSHALREIRDRDGRTRAEIAVLIATELGRPISEETLNKWCSEASGAHRIPLDAFIALVKVTKAIDLLAFVPEMMGYAVVPAHYTEIIELHLIEQKTRELDAAKAKITAKLRSLV